MTEPHYHINLFWSDEDGLWVADAPDLHPCSGHGATRDEALARVRDAIDGWLDSAREQGFVIPEPRYRPAIYAAA